MEKENLLSELMQNCNCKKEKVFELMKTFELAELGADVQKQQIKDITNRVLSENEFFAEKSCERGGIEVKVGDRITDEEFTWLLSDEDFHRLQKLESPYLVAENITDEKGYYIKNWDMIACYARCELVDFLIDEIVPAAFREIFGENRRSIVFQEKMIKAFKDSITPAA